MLGKDKFFLIEAVNKYHRFLLYKFGLTDICNVALHSREFFDSTTKHTDRKRDHYEKSKTSIYGTVVVCVMSGLIIIACCCFCRINPNSPHSFDLDKKHKNEKETDLKVISVVYGQSLII